MSFVFVFIIVFSFLSYQSDLCSRVLFFTLLYLFVFSFAPLPFCLPRFCLDLSFV